MRSIRASAAKLLRKILISLQIIRRFKNWPTAFLDRGKFIRSPNILFELRNGIKYWTRTRTKDRFIINEIYDDFCYTPKGFEIDKNDNIVDIGAHIGVFSIFAAVQACSGRVSSYEPDLENYELLKKNITLNMIKNIFPSNHAVYGSATSQRFYVNLGHNTGVHSLCIIPPQAQVRNVVPITLLSIWQSLNERVIDFLKIDCEGAEYNILFSEPYLLRFIKKISMEYHDINRELNHEELAKYLKSNKFDVIVTPPRIEGDGFLYARNMQTRSSHI